MKSFFQNKINKNNPFVDNGCSQGDEINDMTEEKRDNNEIDNEDIENKEKEEDNIETTETNKEKEEDSENDSETEKMKQDLENLNNQYLRLAADFDNYRKRQAQEREALLKYGAQECMKKIIEVVDNFDRAMQSVEKIDNIEKMKETFFVLNRQLMESLSKMGLEQIKSVGEKFDPNVHEAIMQTQTEEYPEETIIKELQKGYKLGDKVIRPALVDVAVK